MIPKSGNRFSDKDHAPAQNGRQRIDKWLGHARMVRTRSDAAALADAGYVRINGKRIPDNSQPVRVGDVVTLALDRSVRVLRVEGFSERRGAAAAARSLYRDLASDSDKIAPKTAAN
jgi:ribosome-associated heat shock protein Hsp15